MREESIPDVIKDVWVKYWKSILVFAVLGAVVAGMWVQLRPGSYTARAELMTGTYALGPEVESVAAIADAGPLGLELPANSQVQLIDSPATAKQAAKILGDTDAAAIKDLEERTTVSAVTDNSFAIESTGPTAALAAERANAMAQGYLEVRAEKGRAELAQLASKTGLNANTAKDLKAMSKTFDGGGQIYRPAAADLAEGPLNSTILILSGGVIGAVLGFIAALIRRVFTRRVRTNRDLAQVLGDSLVLTGRNSDLVMLREAARSRRVETGESGPLKVTLISPSNPQAEVAATKIVSSRLPGNESDWLFQRGSDTAVSGRGHADDPDMTLGIPVIVIEKGRDDVLDIAALRNQLANLGHTTIAVMLVEPAPSEPTQATPHGVTFGAAKTGTAKTGTAKTGTAE